MEGLPGRAEDLHSSVSADAVTQKWKWCGERYPKQEIIFCAQTLLVYMVCISAVANLSYGTSQPSLWICLLSSCIGYMLPNPSVKRNKTHIRAFQLPDEQPTSIEREQT